MIRVAHADDMPMLRMLVRRVFTTDDRFEVVGEARDGAEALRIVNDTQPDVLLLDLAMPIMDGLEVLRFFRDVGSSPVIVVLSGFSDETAGAALDLGAVAYVNKAIDVKELPGLVADLWHRHGDGRAGNLIEAEQRGLPPI